MGDTIGLRSKESVIVDEDVTRKMLISSFPIDCNNMRRLAFYDSQFACNPDTDA